MKKIVHHKYIIIVFILIACIVPWIVANAVDQPGDYWYGSAGAGVDTCSGSINCNSGGGSSSVPLCPSYQTEYNGACYPPEYCTSTASGGKGGTVTTCSNPPPYSQSGYYNQGTYYSQGGYYFSQPITISTEPSLIRPGEGMILSWNGYNADACTVTNQAGVTVANGGTTGSIELLGIAGEVTYTLTCNVGPTVGTAKATVKILPKIHES